MAHWFSAVAKRNGYFPDEDGHRDDYRGYLESLRAADASIGAVERALAELAERGRETALFIATDHGRADGFREHGSAHPESGRVWLVATGSLVTARGYPLLLGGPRRLADVAPTIRDLARLPSDTSPEAGRVLDEVFVAGSRVRVAARQ
ncbi:MAG TPA: hypothetical protein VK524_24815 [Polyangiaceae bacterium]|nr:hypothetical protein [Polyangiaceae bacterium]